MDQMVYAQLLLKLPLYAPYREGRGSTGNDISGGEVFPGARI